MSERSPSEWLDWVRDGPRGNLEAERVIRCCTPPCTVEDVGYVPMDSIEDGVYVVRTRIDDTLFPAREAFYGNLELKLSAAETIEEWVHGESLFAAPRTNVSEVGVRG